MVVVNDYNKNARRLNGGKSVENTYGYYYRYIYVILYILLYNI